MESFLNRYRNITVLLLVIFAQLILLAVQVKNEQNVRFIRVWMVTAVSPLARLVEGMRGSSIGFIRNYVTLHDADAENRRLKAENAQLKLDNVFLTNELHTADRAKALELFQQQSPSKTLAATVFMKGIGSGKVVYVDRGSVSGVMREMAVITPDGIVGKVSQVYPTSSQVLLISDSDFAAGVVAGKSHVHGTLKGGAPLCRVDQVPFEDKVDPGDWFYTSGDDRIFPRGMPVGVVKSVQPGQPYKEILLEPSGMSNGSPEDVLIVLEGVHQTIPDTPPANQTVYLGKAPPALETPAQPAGTVPAAPAAPGTEADKAKALYQQSVQASGTVLGGGPTGQNIGKPPDFTKLPVDPRSVNAGKSTAPAPAGSPVPGAPPAEKKSTAPTNPDAQRLANQAGGGGGTPQI